MDCVLTVWDYHDGPRTGVAEYLGRPHYFTCLWDEANDDYANVFELSPIDETTLSIAMKQKAIWLTWEDNYYARLVDNSTHPSSSGVDAIYNELQRLLDKVLAALPPERIYATANFVRAETDPDRSPRVMRSYRVIWSDEGADEQSRAGITMVAEYLKRIQEGGS